MDLRYILKWVPKLQAVIVKSGHNFMNLWDIAYISSVLVSDKALILGHTPQKNTAFMTWKIKKEKQVF